MQYLLSRKCILGIFAALLIWHLLILAAPLLAGSTQPVLRRISDYIYLLFSPTCHQLPSRSFHWGSFAFAVCIRCFAFYLAGLLLAAYCIFRRQLRMLPLRIYLLLCAPLLIDFLLEKFDVYTNLTGLRFITGFMAGLVFFHLFLLAVSGKNYSSSSSTFFQR